jgi:hypothetical protein
MAVPPGRAQGGTRTSVERVHHLLGQPTDRAESKKPITHSELTELAGATQIDSGAAIAASVIINHREQIAPFCTPRMTSSVAGSPLPDARQVPGGILDCRGLQVALSERRADDRAAAGRDLVEGVIGGGHT